MKVYALMNEMLYEDFLENIIQLKQFYGFFIKHHKVFLYTFKQTLKKNGYNNSYFQIEKEVNNLYQSIFIEGQFKKTTLIPELTASQLGKSAFRKALANSCLVLLNHFIKLLYDKEQNLHYIKLLTDTMDGLFYFLDKPGEINDLITDPQTEIIAKIEIMRQNRENLILFNTFKGVPIQNDAKIIHTTPASIVLKTEPIQEIAALHQKSVFIIQNRSFPYAIHANIEQTVIKNNNLLVLSNLTFLKHTIQQRQSLRVTPMSTILATLHFDTKVIKTKLFDISIGGLSLIYDHALPLQEAKVLKITLSLPLPQRLDPIEISVKLIYSAKFETYYKFQFISILDKQEEKIISQYISTRQLQIIKELKEKAI